jgi:hypothetical protein
MNLQFYNNETGHSSQYNYNAMAELQFSQNSTIEISHIKI